MAWDIMKVEGTDIEKNGLSKILMQSEHISEWLLISLTPEFEICGSEIHIID